MDLIKRAFKWVLKTSVTVAIVFLMMIFLVSALLTKLSFEEMNRKGVIRPGSFLVLAFPEGLTESPSEQFNITSFNFSELNKRSLILSDVLYGITQASLDNRIKGILLDLDSWNVSAEHTGEIITALNSFKESGKTVTAFGSGLNNLSYYAASGASEIVLDPSNSVTILLNGMSVSVPYFKDAGDKIGVNVNVIHIGQFKGAGENFARNSMSDEYRISILKILEDRMDVYAEAVSLSRSIDKKIYLKKIEDGDLAFITPNEALEYNIVDKLSSYDDLLSELELNKEKLVGIRDYSFTDETESENRIAVILLEGNILDSGYGDRFSESSITPDKFENILSLLKKDKSVKAVVIRINSPGGSALASEKILRKINSIDMPVVVSMGPVAASGGYYISCSADRIFAEPNTVTGSIGVVSMLPNINRLYEKMGIKSEKITMGKYSDIFDLTKEDQEEDIALIRKSMEKIYEEFKFRVSEGRSIPLDELEKIAQGQIWTGRQAKDNGLVDETGGLIKAIGEAASLAGLENYDTVYFPENKMLSERIFNAESLESNVFGSELNDFFKSESKLIKNALMFRNEPVLLLPVYFE
ncbi:MAG: signal peptide peptidase SppA [Candidatus Delongbacteria bacterium]|nr:signal peptide peptidase SppA [Candidatus Delongbacteria bacterium]